MIIDKVTIFAPQDPSVGLFPVWITIDFGGYEVDDLDWFKETLQDCFGQIYDDTVRVYIGDEDDIKCGYLKND